MKQHSTEMKLNGSTWKTAIAVASVRMAMTAQTEDHRRLSQPRQPCQRNHLDF